MKFDPHTVSFIAIIYNLGAIAGGLGVRICLAGLWAAARADHGGVAVDPDRAVLGVLARCRNLARGRRFAMQFMVQGCWGVIPAHLNEMSPGEARGTFPGFVYQLGNFLASTNATIQGVLASAYGGEFSYALAGVAIAAAIAIAIFASLGTEAREIDLKAGAA